MQAAVREPGPVLDCGGSGKGGRRIEPEAAKLLPAYVGTSLREIRNELDKLYIYIGARKEITAADVSALVGMSREFTPFELQKAVGRRETARAMTILQEFLDSGGGIPLVIATMTNYFLTLWKLHDLRRHGAGKAEQAAQLHVNPYFLDEYNEALTAQGPGGCERALLLLAEADERSKSGQYDVRQVMDALIVQLCGADGGNIARPSGV